MKDFSLLCFLPVEPEKWKKVQKDNEADVLILGLVGG